MNFLQFLFNNLQKDKDLFAFQKNIYPLGFCTIYLSTDSLEALFHNAVTQRCNLRGQIQLSFSAIALLLPEIHFFYTLY